MKTYSALVLGEANPGYEHVQSRVLVPWLARPFCWFAKGRLGSWDPVLFGLLAADSIFVALTATLIAIIGTRMLSNYILGLVASLLYLLNFCIPNLRLTGLVDAGEGFFLLALLFSLSESAFWMLPVIAVLGTASKESFVPFSIAFTASWWIVKRKSLGSPTLMAFGLICLWLVELLVILGLQWWTTGRALTPISFVESLNYSHSRSYLGNLKSSLRDPTLVYIFIWLLPAGFPHLRKLPKSWLVPTAATSAMAFILNEYYGGGPGTVSRALFSIAGPILTLSAASFLLNLQRRTNSAVNLVLTCLS